MMMRKRSLLRPGPRSGNGPSKSQRGDASPVAVPGSKPAAHRESRAAQDKRFVAAIISQNAEQLERLIEGAQAVLGEAMNPHADYSWREHQLSHARRAYVYDFEAEQRRLFIARIALGDGARRGLFELQNRGVWAQNDRRRSTDR
jgi:hypothetical protein